MPQKFVGCDAQDSGGNAIRSIKLITSRLSDAVVEGSQRRKEFAGRDEGGRDRGPSPDVFQYVGYAMQVLGGIAEGAQVINISATTSVTGALGFTIKPLDNIITLLRGKTFGPVQIRFGPGALVFAAAGNTGDDVDKFEHCQWDEGPGGAPIALSGIFSAAKRAGTCNASAALERESGKGGPTT